MKTQINYARSNLCMNKKAKEIFHVLIFTHKHKTKTHIYLKEILI